MQAGRSRRMLHFFYCPKLLIFICYFNPQSLSYLPRFIISFWFFKCPTIPTNTMTINYNFVFLHIVNLSTWLVLNVFEKYISLSLVRSHDTNFQTHSQFYGLICKVTQLISGFIGSSTPNNQTFVHKKM